MNRNKKRIDVRIMTQLFFFLTILWIATNHTFSLHAVCPFGGVVSVYNYLAEGVAIKWIHDSSFMLMIIVFILALLFGPVFCGWICPMGSIQEWTGKLGKKMMKKRYNNIVPYKIDRILRYLRYVMLVWVIYMTAKTATLVFWNVDPYHTLFHFWTGEFAISGLAILIIVLVLSLFIERPWCKYACPYGALLGLFNLFRVFKIRRDESSCINCGKCSKECPMNIKVSEKSIVRDHQCISCLKCVSDKCCPVEGTCIMSSGSGRSGNNED